MRAIDWFFENNSTRFELSDCEEALRVSLKLQLTIGKCSPVKFATLLRGKLRKRHRQRRRRRWKGKGKGKSKERYSFELKVARLKDLKWLTGVCNSFFFASSFTCTFISFTCSFSFKLT